MNMRIVKINLVIKREGGIEKKRTTNQGGRDAKGTGNKERMAEKKCTGNKTPRC